MRRKMGMGSGHGEEDEKKYRKFQKSMVLGLIFCSSLLRIGSPCRDRGCPSLSHGLLRTLAEIPPRFLVEISMVFLEMSIARPDFRIRQNEVIRDRFDPHCSSSRTSFFFFWIGSDSDCPCFFLLLFLFCPSLSRYGTRFNLPLLVHLGEESLAPRTQNAARVDWTEYVLDAFSKM